MGYADLLTGPEEDFLVHFKGLIYATAKPFPLEEKKQIGTRDVGSTLKQRHCNDVTTLCGL